MEAQKEAVVTEASPLMDEMCRAVAPVFTHWWIAGSVLLLSAMVFAGAAFITRRDGYTGRYTAIQKAHAWFVALMLLLIIIGIDGMAGGSTLAGLAMLLDGMGGVWLGWKLGGTLFMPKSDDGIVAEESHDGRMSNFRNPIVTPVPHREDTARNTLNDTEGFIRAEVMDENG